MSPADAVVEQIATMCREHGKTVAVVESLTSGAVASALGRGPHAADWFRGAVVAYETTTKELVLGLVPGTDPCSDSCATQLAANGRALLATDVCASVTGVGGPDPTDGHPAGEVHIGVTTVHGTTSHRHQFEGSPEEVVDASVLATLHSLRDALDRLTRD